MVTSVIRGCSVVSVAVRVFEVVGLMESVSPASTLSAPDPAFCTSPCRPVHPPTSAMDSTPALAVPLLSRKVTASLWTPPISLEKCAPEGTPPGVAAVVHAPWNTTS